MCATVLIKTTLVDVINERKFYFILMKPRVDKNSV